MTDQLPHRADYQNAIEFFSKQSQEIPGIIDILLRGSGIEGKIVPGWSDLDFSIILEKITPEACRKIQSLRFQLKTKYIFKISIVVVTRNDYNREVHYHGNAKPAFYTDQVRNDFSLMHNSRHATLLNSDPVCKPDFVADCFQNICMLIHDLRSIVFECSDKLTPSQARHIAKRGKRIATNGVFFHRGHQVDPIDKHISECFGHFGDELLEKVAFLKENWSSYLSKNNIETHNIALEIFFLIEAIYDSILNISKNGESSHEY